MSYLSIEENELKLAKGYHTAKEISQQPDVWKKVISEIERNSDIKTFLENVLSIKDLQIILTGAGTSAFAGEMIFPYLNQNISQPVKAIATTDLVGSPYYFFKRALPTLMISFARSGNSPESVAASKLGKQMVDHFYEIIVTCNAEGDLAKNSINNPNTLLLVMPEETNDIGFAMTSSFSSMALATLAIFNYAQLLNMKSDVERLAEAVEALLKSATSKLKDLATKSFDRYIVLGSGMLQGLSRECALKMLELTAGKISTNFDTPLGFRHGPKSIINNSTLILLLLSDHPYTRKYDQDLLLEMYREKDQNLVIVSGNRLSEEVKANADFNFDLELPEFILSSDLYEPFMFLVICQTLAFFKSVACKITPDNPCPTGEVNRVVQGVKIYDYEEK